MLGGSHGSDYVTNEKLNFNSMSLLFFSCRVLAKLENCLPSRLGIPLQANYLMLSRF